MKARYIEKQIPGAITPMETEGRRLFRFIASQQVRDLDGDTVIAEGVDFTSYYFARGAGPLVLYHDQTRVVGKTLRLGVEALNGIPSLVGIGEIDPPNTGVEADRTWAQLKSGSLNATSIAFLVPPDGAERVPDGGRLLRKILLIHIALVSQPALASAAVLETANAKSCAVCAPEVDLAARIAEVVAEYERLRTKMAIEEYERIRKRAQGEHAYKYVQLWSNAQPYSTACSAAKHAARELNIRMPEVKVFAPCGQAAADFTMGVKVSGYAHAGSWEIGLAADLTEEIMIAWITAHEMKHLDGGDEAAADAFADAFIAKWFGNKSGGSVSFDPVAVAYALRARGMSAAEIRRMF